MKTELNGRKLDHRKLSAVGVDLATKVYGQDAEQAANCLIRPATDPTIEGQLLPIALLTCRALRSFSCKPWTLQLQFTLSSTVGTERCKFSWEHTRMPVKLSRCQFTKLGHLMQAPEGPNSARPGCGCWR